MSCLRKDQLGVSVVICCHNSTSRLPQTLAHLAAQQMNTPAMEAICWEAIVVDNASTDGTAALARKLWPNDAPAPLHVVREPRVGLAYARIRGFAEAQFEFVSFIDDDNWPCPRWVETVFELMHRHPTVGACGGKLTAMSDGALPSWFEQYANSYAVGEQALRSGDITETRGYLWGAGLTIRKDAWEQLLAAGFSPLLSGRSGASLSAGEDHEICLALRLAGWRLWYDERLQLQHYLPAQRLEWHYLCQLRRGFGESFIVLSIYHQILKLPTGLSRHFRQKWFFETAGCFLLLILQWGKLSLSHAMLSDTKQARLLCEYYRGKVHALLRQRTTYKQTVQHIHTLANRLKNRSENSHG